MVEVVAAVLQAIRPVQPIARPIARRFLLSHNPGGRSRRQVRTRNTDWVTRSPGRCPVTGRFSKVAGDPFCRNTECQFSVGTRPIRLHNATFHFQGPLPEGKRVWKTWLPPSAAMTES